MKVRCTVKFRDVEGKLIPDFPVAEDNSWLSAEEALSKLQEGTAIPGDLSTLVDRFSEGCMIRCFGYCFVSLLVMYLLNRIPMIAPLPQLRAASGLVFIALIMRTLNAKVTGFIDANGLTVVFSDKSITFANGVKYCFKG